MIKIKILKLSIDIDRKAKKNFILIKVFWIFDEGELKNLIVFVVYVEG